MNKLYKSSRTSVRALCVRLWTLCAALALITTAGYAQTKVVTGTVTDSSGAPIIGASVFLPGTTVGTVTDATGAFTLSNVPENSNLSVEFLGYVAQTLPVAGKTTLAVTLAEDAQVLDDVVVIGYGTQRRANAVGSIAQLSSEDLAERPIPRIEQALQGQMAGVSVRQTTGKPGADIQIQVRGAASITGESTPLYVVDGVPVQSLQAVNPNDIASINVLKDAASAAIYGSRGSNGVVLVTTKRGQEGAPVINFSAYTGVQSIERRLDILTTDEWLEFNKKWYDRQWVNSGTGRLASNSQDIRIAQAVTEGKLNLTSFTPGTAPWRKELSKQKTAFGLYDPWWGTENLERIDWQDEVYRTAPISDMQLSISGGTAKMNYLVSGGMFSQDGIMTGSSFDRFSGRVNLGSQVNDWMRVGVTLNPTYSISYGADVDGKDQGVSRVVSYPGLVPAGAGKWANADPSHYRPGTVVDVNDNMTLWRYKFYDEWGPGAGVQSPYVQASGPYRKDDNMRLNSSANITLTLTEGLTVDGMYSWNYNSRQDRSFNPAWIAGGWNSATYEGQNVSSRYRTWVSHNNLAQVVANYSHVWGDHALEAMVGASQETFAQNTSDEGHSQFPSDKTWAFSNNTPGQHNNIAINYNANAMVSYFGRANYTFKDRYILTASFRRDGSSKFGPDNRWGNFPSISGAWKFTDEPFMAGAPSWLGPSKLRVSWGLTGNDRIANASFLSNMVGRNYPFGGTVASGFALGNVPNSLLGWEQTASTNIGLDLSFLRGRISLSADGYYKKTTDLLLRSPISSITGVTSMMDNIGAVKNWGLEVDVTTHNITRPNFTWSTQFNVFMNRNEIVELAYGNADVRDGTQANARIQRVGEPINSYLLLEAIRTLRASDFEADGVTPKAGVAIVTGQKPGDTMYRDNDGSGTITDADRAIVGNYQPDFEWGMTNEFRYKNWDLSIFMNGRQGGDLLSIGSRAWNRATNDPKWMYMSSWLHNAYWSEEEPGDGKTPAFFASTTGGQYDTNWLYDASYIRIKNIRLGYNWKLANPGFIKNIRFYVSCDNVYLWDNFYPGYSPEGGTIDGGNSDWGSYPLARTFIGGINITF